MYQIARNFTLRLILSFTVCASLLLLPGVSLLSKASQGQGTARDARPRPRKPEGTLPDLEDVKKESHVEREAPPPIPSTVSAKRNEGKPWDGRRVGDPETFQRPVDQPDAERQTRRAHARRRRAAPPLLSEDQFIQNFFSILGDKNGTTFNDSPKYLKGDNVGPPTVAINGRSFAWIDEPGFLSTPDDPLVSAKFTTNFMVYAQNGSKRCAVEFHIQASFSNGRWQATIGPGLLH